MRTLLLFWLFLPVLIIAQVEDDFSDGDFTSNPSWTGDPGHFRITSSTAVPQEMRPALQLDAPEAGNSCLSVPWSFSGDLEWQFWIKLSMNTSSGNYARFYLLSNTAGLKGALEGYFLQVGGAEDSVFFCKQDSLETSSIFRFASAFTGNSTNSLRFRITRDYQGLWKFYCDSLGGYALSYQGEITDSDYPSGDHFGLLCQYTSSNITKFYFDDIYAGPLIVDTSPPALLQATAVNPSEVLLTFSEPVNSESAENVENYGLAPGIGNPYAAVRLLDPATVHLFFVTEMEPGLVYTLSIQLVKDLAGNGSGPLSTTVMYYSIRPYDLIITEIMADPSPPRELPDIEYLEIMNRSLVSLNLEGIRLSISSKEYQLAGYELLPGGFVIFCDEDAVDIMRHIAPAIGLASFSLPNTGTSIGINDSSGMTVCFLQYDLSWYHDVSKSEGGWSLEMIDTERPCVMSENWAASAGYDGGTPGKINALAGPLSGSLHVINACCTGPAEVLAEFSELLDGFDAALIGHYYAEPFPGVPDSAFPIPPDYKTVRLVFNEPFNPDQIYKLVVNPGLLNCTGYSLGSILEIPFAVPQAALPFDIVINEVLFNPLGDGVDYVEIYNRSSKTIDLQELMLASVKTNTMQLPDTQAVDVASSCRSLFPGQYMVLTSDPEMVKGQYYSENPHAFLELPSFPSFNNDQGKVLLINRSAEVIDGIEYSEAMHFLMLLSYEGVALERISPERPGTDPLNWHSAAGTAGFGTPGYRNSQYLETTGNEDAFSLSPEVFSPDGDGIDDNLGIFYRFDSPGRLINILIFNSEGRLARTLVTNEMPATSGMFSWDGTLDDRTPAVEGIYVIYMEALQMNGKSDRHKKAGVLTRNR